MLASQSFTQAVTRSLSSFHHAIAEPIESSLERLQSSETYLANPSFREKVEWAQDGSSHKLILKSPASTSTIDEEITPEMAVLSTIVQISPSNFFMSSDGNYRGPGRFNIPFSDIKLSCHGGRPMIEELVTNFNLSIENLHWLQNQISTRTFTSKKGLLVENTEGIFIKIRHKLFEVITIFYIYQIFKLIMFVISVWIPNLHLMSKMTKMKKWITNLR